MGFVDLYRMIMGWWSSPPQVRIASIDFTLAKRSIDFTLASRSIEFTLEE